MQRAATADYAALQQNMHLMMMQQYAGSMGPAGAAYSGMHQQREFLPRGRKPIPPNPNSLRQQQKAKEREIENALLRPVKIDDTERMREAVRLGDVKIFRPGDFDNTPTYIAPKNLLPRDLGRTHKIFCGQLGPTSKVQYLVLNVLGEIASTMLYDVREKGRNCRTFAVEGELNRDEVLSWSKGLRSTDTSVYVGLTVYGRHLVQEMGGKLGGPEHPVTIELEHSEYQREQNRQRHRAAATANGGVHPTNPNIVLRADGSAVHSPVTSTPSSPTGTAAPVASTAAPGATATGKKGLSPTAAAFVPGAGYQARPTSTSSVSSPTTDSAPAAMPARMPSSEDIAAAVAAASRESPWATQAGTTAVPPPGTQTANPTETAPLAQSSNRREEKDEWVANILDQLKEV